MGVALEQSDRCGRLALDALGHCSEGGALHPLGSALLKRRRDALGGDAHGVRRRLLGRPRVVADVQVPHYHSTLSTLARHRPRGLTAFPSQPRGASRSPEARAKMATATDMLLVLLLLLLAHDGSGAGTGSRRIGRWR